MSINKVFIFFVISFLFWVFFWNILFNFEKIILFFSWIFLFLILVLIFLKKYHFFLLIIAFWIFLGWVYSWINNYYILQNLSDIEKYYDKKVFIKAEVQELYKKWENNNSYILKINSLDNKTNFKINFLLYYPKNYIIEKWQIISLNSKIIKIDNFSDNFNYQKFMLSNNVYFQVFESNLEFISKKKFSKLTNLIINTRQKILETVYNIYPKNEAIFLAGILIWAREDMWKELSQNFNNSGLTHLVAVSWFNITIIIIFLWFLFWFLPLFLRTFLICFFVVFFVLIVWNNIPVIRAGIMGLIWYFILISGRKVESLSLLLLTAFIIILYNPLYLNYDISFHLSFLAVIWLLYFQSFWSKVFWFLPSFFAIKESFVLTMSALTTTLPIMIFNFWQISILAPITNMLVGGIIPFSMFFGFLSVLWDLILDKIWFIFGFINYFLLKYVVFIANYFWALKFAVYKIDLWVHAIYLEILYFMILVFLIIYFKQEKSPTLKL